MGRRTPLRPQHRRLPSVCLAIGAWMLGAGSRAELSAADLNPQQASGLLTDILGHYFADRPNEAVMVGVLPDDLLRQYAPDKRDLAICLHSPRLSTPAIYPGVNGVPLVAEMPAGMRELLPIAAEVDIIPSPLPAAAPPPSVERIAAMLGGDIDALLWKKKLGGVVLSQPQVDARSRKITFEVSHLDDLSTSTIGLAKKLFGSADFQQAVGGLVTNMAARAARKDVADTVREQLRKKTPEVEAVVDSEHLGFKITVPPLTTGRTPGESSRETAEQIANSEVRLRPAFGKESPRFEKEELERLNSVVRDAARTYHATYHWFLLEHAPSFGFGSLLFYGQFKTVQGGTPLFLVRAVRVPSWFSASAPTEEGRMLKDRLQKLTNSGSISILPRNWSCFVVRFDRGQVTK